MTKSTEVKIFAFHYKPGAIVRRDDSYVHVWAGKNNSSFECALVGDDSAENISAKNSYYSELTGIYWAWKNNRSDIWGTCHYRRFFTLSSDSWFRRLFYYLIRLGRKRHGLIYTSNLSFWKDKIISKEEVMELLQSYDAILPVRRKLSHSVQKHYNRYHHIEDLNMLRRILSDYSPEYLGAFDEMLKQNRLYANNMFILKDETFQELMQWLFDILFEFERQVCLTDYKGYQERIMGFLSERLITCWFMYKQLNVRELNLIYFKKLKFQTER